MDTDALREAALSPPRPRPRRPRRRRRRGRRRGGRGGHAPSLRFPVCFPGASHGPPSLVCTEDSGSRAMFDGMADVYNVLRSTSSGSGGSGGGGGASSRGAAGITRGGGSAFKGICRGCVGYKYKVLKWYDQAHEIENLSRERGRRGERERAEEKKIDS